MDQYPFSSVPVVPCPVCGAEPAARLWFGMNSADYGMYGAGVVLQIGGSAFFPKLLRTSSLVCTGCGYVQLFVESQDLRAKLSQQRKQENA